MKNRILVCTIFYLTIFLNAYAQQSKLAEADKDFKRFAFVDAIENFEKIANLGYQDENMFQKLGDAYYFNSDFPKAFKWYNELFISYPDQKVEYFLRFSQCLKASGNYAKANEIMDKAIKLFQEDSRVAIYKESSDYLNDIKVNSGRFEIASAGVNTKFSDYGTAFLGNKLVFTSDRDTNGVAKKKFKWTDKYFTDLYWSELSLDGKIGDVHSFQKRINTKFNESSPCFTKDGKVMFFTRNAFLKNKNKQYKELNSVLKIYRASLINGVWDEIVELPFNSDLYNVAHPTLSIDEKTLYFVSDMPSSIGQSDIFRVSINNDGTFGVPINLGKEINTEGRESFPFISEENELYFSSDGHQGLGGYDVFVSKIDSESNTFGFAQNVGEPLNSKFDDFAFTINSKSKNGFFSSNRPGGLGSDDIYRFLEFQKLVCDQKLFGIVTDSETGLPLAGAEVSLFDKDNNFIEKVVLDKNGAYSFKVDCRKWYVIRGTFNDYFTNEVAVKSKRVSGMLEVPLRLQKRKKIIEVGTDLAQTLNIPNIYFDFDKASISKEAHFNLSQLLVVLEQYPSIKLIINAHTDSRQSANYNLKLSNRRAKSCVDWLVKKGIDVNRLVPKGFGETKIKNDCVDGVKCSEEQHQVNRRCEFIITYM